VWLLQFAKVARDQNTLKNNLKIMKTISINLYSFNELSEEAQQKALDHYRYFMVEDSWWDSIYSDAKEIGLKITSFDLDRNRNAKGELLHSFEEVCCNILKNHGKVIQNE
jgi:hypothetical protein